MEIGAIIGILTVIVNAFIAIWSIKTNRQIEKENAGKNRIVYSMEEVMISPDSKRSFGELNEKLNSGSYAVMNVIQNSGNNSQRIYTLCKIVK